MMFNENIICDENDKYVLSILWPKKICLLNRCKNKITSEIENYLLNRFKYSESLYETLFCLKYNIDRDKKICPVCGVGILKFNGNERNDYFIKGCCTECIYKLRDKKSTETSLKKYGVTHPTKNKTINNDILEKRKITCLEKYGVEYASSSPIIKDKVKQKCLEKYGVEYAFQSDEVKQKIKDTCKERYGTEWTFQNEEAKTKYCETCLKKYGVNNTFLIPEVLESFKLRKNEIQEKRNNTKRKRKTFNTSLLESKTYKMLLNKFDINDIIRQYNDKIRYPFNCDFYIKSLDLFIECNYFWTHHNHYYNENDAADKIELERMVNLSNTHKFYKCAITVWTKSDLLKRDTAINNKLNYIVFWKYTEFEKWYNDLNF